MTNQNSMIGKQVIIDVYVDDSSIGHTEPRKGKIIAEREVTKDRWRKPSYKVKEYAVEIGEIIVWKEAEDINLIPKGKVFGSSDV